VVRGELEFLSPGSSGSENAWPGVPAVNQDLCLPECKGIAWEGAAARRCEMVITCGHGDQASAEDIVVITALDTEA
jgi:hypothetical protein